MVQRLLPFLILGIIFLIGGSRLSTPIRDQSVRAIGPATGFLNQQRSRYSQFAQSIGQIGNLRQEQAGLENEINQLQGQLSQMEVLKNENIALKAELGVTGVSHDLNKVLATVVLYGTNPLDRTFTVNVGSSQGIKVGQPAVSGGYLVGVVISVREHSAVVRSVISPQSTIQVWLPTLNQKGLLIGDTNTLRVEKLSQSVDFPLNSLVETSGLGGSLPQGILVGSLGSILSKPSDLSQSFRVEPPKDPALITTLMILLTDPHVD